MFLKSLVKGHLWDLCGIPSVGFKAHGPEKGEDLGSCSTSGICQARQRLKPELIEKVHSLTRAYFDQRQPEVPGFGRRRIRLVDSTTVTAADTEANQIAFPQSDQCAKGCGFPLIRITALMDLNSASVVKTVIDDYKTSELVAAARDLLGELQPDDIIVGDRLFQSYGIIASVLEQKADVVVRVKGQWRKTLKPVKGGRAGDRLVEVRRPQNRNPLYDGRWENFPEKLTLRLISFQGRDRDGKRKTFHLLTSLTDMETYGAESIAYLYWRRWQIELGFRDMKVTLGMDRLRTKSPEMVRKDISLFVIAYNLVRYLHLNVSILYGFPVERLSVKGTVDTVLRIAPTAHYHRTHRLKLRDVIHELLDLILADPVPWRPGRFEPRKRKFRSNGKEWLTKPRGSWKKGKNLGIDFELMTA